MPLVLVIKRSLWRRISKDLESLIQCFTLRKQQKFITEIQKWMNDFGVGSGMNNVQALHGLGSKGL